MRSKRRAGLFLAGFSIITVLGLVGTTAGTLAWYSYSVRTQAAYEGTSVGKSEQLQLGIVDDEQYISNDIVVASKYSREANDGHSIVWAPAGTGFTSSVISNYLLQSGNYDFYEGHSSLSPVTSKVRELINNEDLTLYNSFISGFPATNSVASPSSYVVIPFVFRVIDNNGNYVGNSNVWITDAKAQTSGSENVHKAMRIFFESSESKFLLNPTSNDDGSTALAGLLDLDADGYYDYDKTTLKEIVYGEGDYSGTPTYSSNKTTSDSELIDINNTGATEATTFYAKHKDGVYTTDYTGLTFGEAKYYGMNSARPVDDGSGKFTGGLPVTKTDATSKLGYSTLTIYLEGWDHGVIDQAVGYRFNLGLQFEINRI